MSSMKARETTGSGTAAEVFRDVRDAVTSRIRAGQGSSCSALSSAPCGQILQASTEPLRKGCSLETSLNVKSSPARRPSRSGVQLLSLNKPSRCLASSPVGTTLPLHNRLEETTVDYLAMATGDRQDTEPRRRAARKII